MDIIFITDNFYIGGIEKYIEMFSEELNKKNNYCSLICWDYLKNKIPRNIKKVYSVKANTKIGNLNRFLKFYYHYKYLKKIFKKEPGIIILNMTKSAYYSTIPIKKLKKMGWKIYFQFHSSLHKDTLCDLKNIEGKIIKKQKKMENKVYSTVDKVIVFSDYSRKLVLDVINEKNKILKILPGINNKKYSNIISAKKNLGLDNETPLILCVSRLERRKGAIEFIKIINLIKKKIKINAILATTIELYSHESEDFFKQYSNNKDNKSVFFIDNPNKKERDILYGAADIIVIPSIELETFCFTIFESYEYNKPVAAFKIGANGENIFHNKTGFIRNLNNKNALANDIVKYIKSNDLNKTNFSNNIKNHLNKFSWEKYTQTVINIK